MEFGIFFFLNKFYFRFLINDKCELTDYSKIMVGNSSLEFFYLKE
jgi:hypothetical protein